jgi:aspartyl-tRNA(Asn)/glutamyl-tRNA(Gln) amidotransferase subunit A
VPIAHKDIFVTQESATTAGSKMLEGYRARSTPPSSRA